VHNTDTHSVHNLFSPVQDVQSKERTSAGKKDLHVHWYSGWQAESPGEDHSVPAGDSQTHPGETVHVFDVIVQSLCRAGTVYVFCVSMVLKLRFSS
jgi:hypothetical protein